MPHTGKVLNLDDILTKDRLGCQISDFWLTWDMYRRGWKAEKEDIRKYVYATSTSTTPNKSLPWKNTTTVPKLTQIRDNLYANYLASMFPSRKWLVWEGETQADETKEKIDAINAYMGYVVEQPDFFDSVSKLILDYIDYGICFAMPEWEDRRVETATGIKQGYVGPVLKRISPLDIVFNPTAPSITQSPKLVRSIISLGELKERLERLSSDEGEQRRNQELYNYLKGIRNHVSISPGDLSSVDAFFSVDGFTDFRSYLESDYCEVLTFYGDIYDRETDTLLKNYIIEVVDRHKIIRKEANPAGFGYPPIFSVSWRPRQDNLWGMGPLDNLVGMQYRIDHLENLKADLMDLTAFPPLKVKGYVEEFSWGPFEKIYVGDEGDVEIMQVDVQALQANFEIQNLENKMEEMAGAPKEAMGFRTPGEKTKYEVQRLENASARIFQSKIKQFEIYELEPTLNAMLELARRNMADTVVRVLNDEYKVAGFMKISPEDIAGAGRLRPIAARHFVEQAERIQNITQFLTSPAGQDQAIMQHFSGIGLAKFFEENLELERYKIVTPYIRISEMGEAQSLMNQAEEDNAMAMQTSAGIAPDDFDLDAGPPLG